MARFEHFALLISFIRGIPFPLRQIERRQGEEEFKKWTPLSNLIKLKQIQGGNA